MLCLCPPSCGLILLVCLGIALPAQSGWACLWVVSACVIVAATRQHHQHVPAPGASGSSNEDVEQPSSGTVNAICASTQGAADGQTKASPLRSSDSSAGSAREKRACWRQCGVGCGHCVAWSSLFWVAVLGAFLVIQSAYLASDLRAFPPPGVLVSVPITLAGGGTGVWRGQELACCAGGPLCAPACVPRSLTHRAVALSCSHGEAAPALQRAPQHARAQHLHPCGQRRQPRRHDGRVGRRAGCRLREGLLVRPPGLRMVRRRHQAHHQLQGVCLCACAVGLLHPCPEAPVLMRLCAACNAARTGH